MNRYRSPRSSAVLCWTLASLVSACGGTSTILGDPGNSGGTKASGTNGSGTNGSGSTSATPGVNVPIEGPGFPGGGQFGADEPITADPSPAACAPGHGGDTSHTVISTDDATCYFPTSSGTTPAAIVERVLEVAQNEQVVHVRLTLNPAFVDNTYGSTAIGWGGSDSDAGTTEPKAGADSDPKAEAGAGPGANPKPGDPKGGKAGPGAAPPAPGPGHKKGGHTFDDLVGSDKAQFVLTDGQGSTVLDFYLDYISVDSSRPSGYGCLGVTGGEGKMNVGDASAIVAASSSLDRDLNACGYGSYTVDSPATDDSYTPNPATPGWDYRVVYDVWVKAAAFGSSGFGKATISYVHASPSKETSNTVDVTPGPCPPAGGGGQGTGGAGGSAQTDEEGGYGGEPSPPACLQNQEACTSPEQCCGGICCQGMCGMSQCIH